MAALSDDKRKKLLYLLQYLLENTDENHAVKTPDIIEHLENEYDIPIERKTVYTDIKLLQDYGDTIGIEIEYDTITKGYKVIQREFELDELQLLIDSVYSLKFITKRKAKELTDKIKRLTSRHNRQLLDVYTKEKSENINERAFYNFDTLRKAIENNNKIRFKYFDYNIKKEKLYTEYDNVSPFEIVLRKGNYYLLSDCGDNRYFFHMVMIDSEIALEIANMESIEIIKNSKRERREKRNDEQGYIKLFATKYFAESVIKRYGKDIMIIPYDEEVFSVTVPDYPSINFFHWIWEQSTIPYSFIQIIAPDSAVEEMKRYLSYIVEVQRIDTKEIDKLIKQRQLKRKAEFEAKMKEYENRKQT